MGSHSCTSTNGENNNYRIPRLTCQSNEFGAGSCVVSDIFDKNQPFRVQVKQCLCLLKYFLYEQLQKWFKHWKSDSSTAIIICTISTLFVGHVTLSSTGLTSMYIDNDDIIMKGCGVNSTCVDIELTKLQVKYRSWMYSAETVQIVMTILRGLFLGINLIPIVTHDFDEAELMASSGDEDMEIDPINAYLTPEEEEERTIEDSEEWMSENEVDGVRQAAEDGKRYEFHEKYVKGIRSQECGGFMSDGDPEVRKMIIDECEGEVETCSEDCEFEEKVVDKIKVSKCARRRRLSFKNNNTCADGLTVGDWKRTDSVDGGSSRSRSTIGKSKYQVGYFS